MPPQHFTLEEATSLLPQLSDILLAMQARKRDLDGLRQQLAEAAAQGALPGGEPITQAAEQAARRGAVRARVRVGRQAVTRAEADGLS